MTQPALFPSGEAVSATPALVSRVEKALELIKPEFASFVLIASAGPPARGKAACVTTHGDYVELQSMARRWSGGDEDRDLKLRALLDAARELVECPDSGPHFRAQALDALEAAARAWAADECPICGRRGDHEWNELSGAQRAAHEADAASQGR